MATGQLNRTAYEAERMAVPVMRAPRRWPFPFWTDICWKARTTLFLLAAGLALQIVILWVGP